MGTVMRFWTASLVMVAGCGGTDVDIVGSLELETEAVRAQLGSDPVGPPSVGLLGDDVMVSWTVGAPEPPSRSMPFRLRAAWLDVQGRPRSDVQDLGPSMGNPQQWVRRGSELFAQHWGDPLERGDPRESERVFLLRGAPGVPIGNRPVGLSLADPGCEGCAQLRLGGITGGGIVPLPTLALDDRVLGALTAMPRQSPCNGLGSYQRLHLFDDRPPEGPLTGTVSSWVETLCDPDPIAAKQARVEQPFLLRLSNGEPAVLLRWEGGERPVDIYLVPLDRESLQPTAPPRRVGSDPLTGSGDGYLPQGASAGGRVVLSERVSLGNNYCHGLRVANDDGSDAHDAPWQLPCVRDGDESWITVQPRIVPLPGAVLLVWDQRSGPMLIPSVAAHEGYEEGLFAVVLTPDGRRGSEIIELTSDEHTAVFGDRPGQYRASVAVDGDRIVVSWLDLRADAPGIYMRMLRFAPNAVAATEESP